MGGRPSDRQKRMGPIGRAQAIAAWFMCRPLGGAEPELQRTPRGARLIQHGSVLSEVLARQGPTDSVFDVLAAAMNLSNGKRAGILGFAGGGVVAPLRAMNGKHEFSGVDLDETGYDLFCDVSDDWRGTVKFTKSDAAKWLQAQRKPFDVLLEDLSVPRDDDVFKPDVSIDTLPHLIRRKLKPGGIAVFNLLPAENRTWSEMIRKVSEPFRCGVKITFESFYNQILVLSGRPFSSTREVSRRIRGSLAVIQSAMSTDIQVRALRLAKR